MALAKASANVAVNYRERGEEAASVVDASSCITTSWSWWLGVCQLEAAFARAGRVKLPKRFRHCVCPETALVSQEV